jgi:methylphosphotriester-DNA--protein-cysteine methyltransferase
MATSRLGRFTDPDALVAALRPADVQHTVIERGRFSIDFVSLDLGRLRLQVGNEKLSRIARVEAPRDRHLFGFLAGPFVPGVAAGIELLPNMIVQHAPRTVYYQRIDGPTVWANLSLGDHALAAIETMTGRSHRGSDKPRTYLPAAAAMQRLMSLARDAVNLAQTTPDILETPWAARGLECAMFDALAHCVVCSEVSPERTAYRNHRDVVARFDKFLADNPDMALFMPDVCEVLKTPLRTIRLCCHEHFGMGPKQFFMLRRLNQVRQALLSPASDDITVTNTATAFGFWELGRFSVAFRELFEESPSATLRRSRGQMSTQEAADDNRSPIGAVPAAENRAAWSSFGSPLTACG